MRVLLSMALSIGFQLIALDLPAQITWDSEHPPGAGSVTRQIRPVNCQLYPRNQNNCAYVRCNGTLAEEYTGISFKVARTRRGEPRVYSETYTLPLDSDGHFAFSYRIKASLTEYAFFYRLKVGNESLSWKLLADSIVCGDAFIIAGQSNACPDIGSEADSIDQLYGLGSEYGEYARSYGHRGRSSPYDAWGVSRENSTQHRFRVGAWGLFLQYEIASRYQIPTCIINGAVGSTSVEQQLLHSTPYDPDDIFGSTNYKVYKAGLENDLRGIFFYLGETDSDIRTPVQDFLQRFDSLYSGWHTYFPGYSKTYVIQAHSFYGCQKCIDIPGMVREFPGYFPDLEVISTNGIQFMNSIHFFAPGYINLGKRVLQLLERDWYCVAGNTEFCVPPDIRKVYMTYGPDSSHLVMEFDRPVFIGSTKLTDVLPVIFIDSIQALKILHIKSCQVSGNTMVLASSNSSWNPEKVSYLGIIPYPGYDNYLRNRVYSDPAYDIAALSFKVQLPYNWSGTWVDHYLANPVMPYSRYAGIASGLLEGQIRTDQKAFEIFNIPSTSPNAEIVAFDTVEIRAARRITLNPGFSVQYGAFAVFRAGDDLFAFTRDNTCDGAASADTTETIGIRPEDEHPAVSPYQQMCMVFPNPSDGIIRFKGECANLEDVEFQVINPMGQMLLRQALTEQEYLHSVDCCLLPSGIYLARIVSDAGILCTGKFLINR